MKIKKGIYITNNFEETQEVGEDFAGKIFSEISLERDKAFVIALYGDLGGGKTTFVQGMARGLRISRVISPTFTIIKQYKIKNKILNIKNTNKKFKNLYHIDLYRIQKAVDTQGLGIKEILDDQNNIVVIEWAERMGNLLPEERIDIKFEYLGDDRRKIITKKLFDC